jgi:preprotein translocase subunit YajC
MFVTPAFAQAGGGAGGGFDIVALLPLVLIFVVFYFLLIRPQQKKVKQHQSMVQSLRRGDKIVTGGGVIGTVAKVLNDNELAVEIAEGVRIRVVRSTITEVLTKPDGGAKASAGTAANDAGGGAPKRGLLGGFGGFGGTKPK